MSDDERFVREVWRIQVADVGSGDWEIWAGNLCLGAYSTRGNDVRQAWSAARQWTDARIEEVEDVREEIDWLNRASDWARDTAEQKRILASRRAEQSRLVANMRPEYLAERGWSQ